MKNSHRIGFATTVLVLAGSLALAGERAEGAENSLAAGGGDSRQLTVAADTNKGGFVELDRKYPEGALTDRTDICGALGTDEKCRPRPLAERVERESYGRYVGACLPYTILGRLFCWN